MMHHYWEYEKSQERQRKRLEKMVSGNLDLFDREILELEYKAVEAWWRAEAYIEPDGRVFDISRESYDKAKREWFDCNEKLMELEQVRTLRNQVRELEDKVRKLEIRS